MQSTPTSLPARLLQLLFPAALAVGLLGAQVAASPSQAGPDCEPGWLPTFGAKPGVAGGPVGAMAVFDDGAGPALFVAGDFKTAGTVSANRVARWDGAEFTPLGSGLGGILIGHVSALAVFDDGGGPALYAGGQFALADGMPAARVAKWDGTSWSPLGSGMSGGLISAATVIALAVFDDGSGPALYAGGDFTVAGGVAVGHVARWDGTSWASVGAGVDGAFFPIVSALAVFDDGDGPALYAGGRFSTAGGVAATNVARWDGTSWSAVDGGGGGVSGNMVRALVGFDDGGGPALYAGGDFSGAGGVPASHVARWDGAAWSPLGSGTNDVVSALLVHDDGSGAALHVGGTFTAAGGMPAIGVARWDAQGWSSAGLPQHGSVFALAEFDEGAGARLFAGGALFDGVFGLGVLRREGATWSPLGVGLTSEVRALAVLDDGGVSALYAGGSFASAAGVPASRIARWDGAGWSPLGAGLNSYATSLAVFDDGGGPALYAGGAFSQAGGASAKHVAKWDGAGWSPLGSGLDQPPFGASVSALAVFDDGGGPALYVAGNFALAGGVPAHNVARWNGASWSALGSGTGGFVRCFGVFDDGTGPALYVGGTFLTAGGAAANRIAKWDGTSWSALGSGLDEGVSALAAFDDGTGPALYAGGEFTTAGGVAASGIARWDGANWTPVGGGVAPTGTSGPGVLSLAVFDDGGGSALYAGGRFSIAGGEPVSNVARWDGASWEAVGGGTNGDVLSFAAFDDGTGTGLFAGGSFVTAADSGDSFLAKWGCPAITPVPGCHGNPATLSAVSSAAKIGHPFELQLEAGAVPAGTGLCFAGLDGTDAAGCGILVAGFGELLLALLPPPIQLAQAPLTAGSAAFSVAFPPQPSLVGLTILLQAVSIGPLPAAPIEFSTGLSVRIGA